ncbi:unnamed protein product [Durusdinium trenchii]|uniref:C3H1-type domain-containing protein n=1 Tax=Durusdinium trenchii TaxID=1381693 RepID=A0ABP0R3W8_9DINO
MASTSSATTEEGGLHSEFRVPVTRAIPVPRFATVTMHQLGKCIPCRFFAFKDDGCHKGSKCEFCHLCGPTEALRRSKKVHTARKKQEEAVLRREAHTGADRSQTGAVVRTRPVTFSFWL